MHALRRTARHGPFTPHPLPPDRSALHVYIKRVAFVWLQDGFPTRHQSKPFSTHDPSISPRGICWQCYLQEVLASFIIVSCSSPMEVHLLQNPPMRAAIGATPHGVVQAANLCLRGIGNHVDLWWA